MENHQRNIENTENTRERFCYFLHTSSSVPSSSIADMFHGLVGRSLALLDIAFQVPYWVLINITYSENRMGVFLDHRSVLPSHHGVIT